MSPARDDATTFEDRYEVLGELGRGGFGVVLRARRRSDGVEVAAKVTDPTRDDLLRGRILREARLLEEVRHPRLTSLLGCLPAKTGGLVLVYELVEGEPLDRVLGEGPPPLPEALGWIGDVAEGLDALHAAGLVHRDLKPGNLIREPGGRIRLLDFGLARPEVAGETLTATGVILGTPGFMAPEQLARGLCDRGVDLYALGSVAFTILTGRLAFPGDLPEVLAAQRGAPPRASERNPALPRALDDVLARALARDPSDRPGSGRDLHTALAAAGAAPGAGGNPTLEAVERAAPTASLPGVAGGGGGERTAEVPGAVPRAPAAGEERTAEVVGGDAPEPGAGGARHAAGPGPSGATPARGASRARLLLPGLFALLVLVGAATTRAPGPATPVEAAGPRGPGVEEALEALGGARRDLEAESTIREVLALTDAVETREADYRWERGRRAYRRAVAELRPAVDALVAAGPPPRVYPDASWLLRLEGWLTRTGSPAYAVHGPLFDEEAPDPGLARLVAPFVRMAPLRQLGGTMYYPWTRRIADTRAGLPGGEDSYVVLRDYASVVAEQEAEGRPTNSHSLRPRNPRGEDFRDPSQPLGEGGAVVAQMLGQLGEYKDAPTEVPLPLAPFEGDLQVILLGSEFLPRFQIWIEVEGGGERAVAHAYAPEPWGAVVGIHKPRVAFVVEIAREVLPATIERGTLTARALQPVGDPRWVYQVEEAYQRVGPVAPPELLEVLERFAIPPF